MPQTADTLHRTRSSFFAFGAASVLLLGFVAGGFWAANQVAMVPSAVPAYMAVEDSNDHVSLSSSTHAPQLRISASGPIWREITESQRQVLMPLRERWDSMGALAKRRWLVLADRFPKMDESERAKLVSRMNTWASLSAQQRNQARLNFESTKRLSAKELQEKWDAYQALSEAEKKRLAEQASKAKAAKKTKRKLSRAAKTKVEAPSNATSTADIAKPSTPPPTAVETSPVLTPQAAPMQHLEPLPSKKNAPTPLPEMPAASSQPVWVPPSSIPTTDLPPLPKADASTTVPSADPHQHAGPETVHIPESVAPIATQ